MPFYSRGNGISSRSNSNEKSHFWYFNIMSERKWTIEKKALRKEYTEHVKPVISSFVQQSQSELLATQTNVCVSTWVCVCVVTYYSLLSVRWSVCRSAIPFIFVVVRPLTTCAAAAFQLPWIYPIFTWNLFICFFNSVVFSSYKTIHHLVWCPCVFLSSCIHTCVYVYKLSWVEWKKCIHIWNRKNKATRKINEKCTDLQK